MKNCECVFRGAVMTVLAVVATTGCSSWRYRGFLDEAKQAGGSKASQAYRIESVDFDNFRLEVASGDGAFTQWVANKVYVPFYDDLSKGDPLNERTYVQDITDATDGYCCYALDAIPISIRLAPHREESRGSWSSLFPLFLTLGIVPSNKSCDAPFDIEVSFPDGEPRMAKADLRIDSRFALSPFGSVRYQPLDGMESCEMVAGSFLFSERDAALRKAFVQTVANAVKLAIAEREKLKLSNHAEVAYEKDETPVVFKDVIICDVPEDRKAPVDDGGPTDPGKQNEQNADNFFDSDEEGVQE